jgi:hypothetical protein
MIFYFFFSPFCDFKKDEKEPFSDLDEIIANYIGPMNDFVAQMMAFRAFHNGDVEEVKPLLIQKHKGLFPQTYNFKSLYLSLSIYIYS